jgi:hypothetical protein
MVNIPLFFIYTADTKEDAETIPITPMWRRAKDD